MKRGRTLLVVTLIVALIVTGTVQSVAANRRHVLLRTNVAGSGQSLAAMNSFSLALVLGGLRGPLVMFLWTQSESQKSEKNLEGVETQIEWIRLLQPEFDSVHLFQIWNKAYNLSVQMASVSNKYSVILDALDYAHNVDRERPDDLNIIMAMAGVFNDKLSGSQEKKDYRAFMRRDTTYRQQKKIDRVAGIRPTRYDSILDPAGNIRTDLLTPRFTQTPTTNPTAMESFYDGSDLQFLKRYEPFPYGVSPTGLAYNYFKRTQTLQRTSGQRHLQMSAMVIDSRAAVAIKSWSEEEHELGTRSEAAYWGVKVPVDRFDVITAVTDHAPQAAAGDKDAAKNAAYVQATYQYSLARRLMEDAATEFRDHLSNPDYYMSHADQYRSQIEHIAAAQRLMRGDELYLQAARAEGVQRTELLATAKQAYAEAARRFAILRLRYFLDDGVVSTGVFPAGVNKQNLEMLADAPIQEIIRAADLCIKKLPYDPNVDETREYNTYIQHSLKRADLCRN